MSPLGGPASLLPPGEHPYPALAGTRQGSGSKTTEVGGGGRSSQQVSPGKGWPGQVGGCQEASEAQPGPAMPVAGRLSVERDYGGGMRFRLQASDLIPEQPCAGVSVLPPPMSL